MLIFPRAEDRSPWGDFWFTPIGSQTASNMAVTGTTALKHAAVYACVRVLAETFAMLPFQLSRQIGGKRVYVTQHWLYQLLGSRPNDRQNRFEWHEMMMGHLALRGNAYNRIIADGNGEVTDLQPLPPDRVRMEVGANGDFRYKIKDLAGHEEIVPRGEIWQIRGLSSDGYMGLSPIELAAQTIGLGLGVQEYGARFFANDARPGGGWIEHPSSFKDKESRANFKESWQKAQTANNRHKTAVLEYGMKYHELAIKNNDAQFLETRAFQVIDICRIFRVPPHLVADLTRGTFSNIEQQSLEFMSYTMAPWAERFEASIENTFLPDGEGWQVEYDFTHLMRGDAASRTQYYTGGITSGWLTRNEARIAEGYEPLPGLDTPLAPMNMGGGNKRPGQGQPGEDGSQGQDEASQNDGPPERGPAPAVHRISIATATRVLRKEIGALTRLFDLNEPHRALAGAAAFYARHVDFVADTFAASPERARTWCEEQRELLAAAADPHALLEAWGAGTERIERLATLMMR
jgi:HK97 family phage portal protein